LLIADGWNKLRLEQDDNQQPATNNQQPTTSNQQPAINKFFPQLF
jgi:hypothetical protein